MPSLFDEPSPPLEECATWKAGGASQLIDPSGRRKQPPLQEHMRRRPCRREEFAKWEVHCGRLSPRVCRCGTACHSCQLTNDTRATSAGWFGTIGEVLSVKNAEPIDVLWLDGAVNSVVKPEAVIKCASEYRGLKVSCSAPTARRSTMPENITAYGLSIRRRSRATARQLRRHS